MLTKRIRAKGHFYTQMNVRLLHELAEKTVQPFLFIQPDIIATVKVSNIICFSGTFLDCIPDSI